MKKLSFESLKLEKFAKAQVTDASNIKGGSSPGFEGTMKTIHKETWEGGHYKCDHTNAPDNILDLA